MYKLTLCGGNMVDYKSIGRRISINRRKANVTQAWLAEKIDVSESFISQIERGKAKISLSRLYEIADCLDIDVAVLVSDCRKLNECEINSELDDIIKYSTQEQREFLSGIIDCLDKKIKSN